MKLRYLRARNVLSFGDEGVELEFNPFSVVAGPNDSGKTNLFRALGLIEQALNYAKLPLEEILFKGENERTLRLEVGVELDDIELELLAKLIICGEIMTIASEKKEIIVNDKQWKTILLNYGYQILLKSLRYLSFILSKDELRLSEPKMVLQVSDEPRFFVNRQSQMTKTDQEIGGYQKLSLGEEIWNKFYSRFGQPSETEVNSILQDGKKLSDRSPALKELLKGKFDGCIPPRIIELRGGGFHDYVNKLRGDPILNDLSRLLELRGIKRDRLYMWEILSQMYSTSFVNLKELRFFQSNSAKSSFSQDLKGTNLYGSYLAKNLFWLTSSGLRKNREKYSRIQKEFKDLTGAEFDIVVREKEVDVISAGEFGVMVHHEASSVYGSSEFAPLIVRKENKKQLVNEASVQIIKDNHPISIEQTASGLYEILLLLTAIIGESGKILLLDEPELHLHPTMQKRILNLLSEFGTKDRNQIVLITHSPYLVSAEQIDNTWRFTSAPKGTKVHNIGEEVSKLQKQEKVKCDLKLSTPDVRSILFSRGVVLVEGISDKITIEEIDRFLSDKEEGANLDENEWSILDIGSKKSLASFSILCRMLDVRSLAILDYDALMRKERIIKVNGREVKTSTIFVALQHGGQLEDSQSNADLLSEASDSEWYAKSHLEKLQTMAKAQGIFVFSSDLEGVMQSRKTGKKNKPLNALERILELISQNKIPSEFYGMCDFLKEKIKEIDKSLL